ncbi:MAG TPA: hypothetical protein VK607_10745 [Kofleriaceae bacterium]|nr:hypothetical protein [Kofleriaceae bacterium]
MPGLDTSTVLTIFKNDTSQAEAAVKRLRGVERTRAKENLNELQAQNKDLAGQVAMFTKVGVAVGAAVGIYKLAQGAARSYLEDVRLQSAAGAVAIDKLKVATHGLVEEDDLLKFAGQAQHGVWKLTEEQMQRVLAGANALRIGGQDLHDVMDALGESVIKGSAKSLRALGIEAKSAGDLVVQMDKRVAALGGKTTLAGDQFQAGAVKMKDAVDNLKGAFGHLVVEGSEPASESMGGLVQGLADGVEWLARLNDSLTKSRENFFAMTDAALGFDTARRRTLAPRLDEQTQLGPTLAAEISVAGKDFGRQLAPFISDAFKKGAELLADRIIGAGITLETRIAQSLAKRGPDPFTAITVNPELPEGFHAELQRKVAANPIIIPLEPGFLDLALRTPDAVRSITDALRNVDLSELGQELGVRFRQVIDDAAATHAVTGAIQDFVDQEAFANFQAQGERFMQQAEVWNERAQRLGQTKVLEQIFGSKANVNESTVAIYGASKAFGAFGSAAAAAMDAAITGQKSVAEAVKDAIGESLRATAIEASVNALKETAFGIASLALGPIGGVAAGGHFAAAAQFAAVAAAAGIGAGLMGAGHSSGAGPAATSSAGAALGPAPRGQAPADAGPSSTTILVGKDLLGLPDLEQRQLIYEAIKRGKVLDVKTTTVRRG